MHPPLDSLKDPLIKLLSYELSFVCMDHFYKIFKQNYYKMRISTIAGLFIVLVASFAEAQRQCENDAAGCRACVCHHWVDTSKCCYGEFNNSNGNCEGIRVANTGPFQACCNGNGGFGRCW
ncbi:hypothetical protein BGZ95_006280 [Linnemannia exigua]|uniref:Uncharacterized protein n=1 Tax=Linnemannia exigua TaxID=604196 RepID=A0AAD4H261_9FUNG|nr:hypothetical protein BGZ95_006280 [Linnemannia exigua]